MADEQPASWREDRKTPPAAEKAKAPRTKVKMGGKVNRRLTVLAQMYLKLHPDKSVRYVYSPLHKPELSNVVNRQVDGYVLVYVKDLGKGAVDLLPGEKTDDLVRVGDVILMAIDAALRNEYLEEADQIAIDERARVETDFYGSIEQIPVKSPGHAPRARGRSVIEEVEKEVEGPETHRES